VAPFVRERKSASYDVVLSLLLRCERVAALEAAALTCLPEVRVTPWMPRRSASGSLNVVSSFEPAGLGPAR
jgi:hypothetical protein